MEFSKQELNAVPGGRKMATIRIIDEIRPHNNADKLELAIIGGWQCVVNKGEFRAGEAALYFEIDSWIPHEIAPFLSKGHEPREYEGVKGERLKTIKLRKELSQGLVLPLSVLPWDEVLTAEFRDLSMDDCVGMDVSEILNVKKWERTLPANITGNARRYFPPFLRKTDQERVQNLLGVLQRRQLEQPNEEFEATLKIDGSSTTFYVNRNESGEIETGVCSRNLELKTDESNDENTFVQMYRKLEIDNKLRVFNALTQRHIAIQGEMYGAGINGNWEGIADVRFLVFDVFDIDRQCYCTADDRLSIVASLRLPHVPVLGVGILANLGIDAMEIGKFLAYADRISIHNDIAEGVVFKSLSDPDFSFKVVNNKYLLNGGN